MCESSHHGVQESSANGMLRPHGWCVCVLPLLSQFSVHLVPAFFVPFGEVGVDVGCQASGDKSSMCTQAEFNGTSLSSALEVAAQESVTVLLLLIVARMKVRR